MQNPFHAGAKKDVALVTAGSGSVALLRNRMPAALHKKRPVFSTGAPAGYRCVVEKSP